MIKKIILFTVALIGMFVVTDNIHADSLQMLSTEQVEVLYQYVEFDEYDFPTFNTIAMFDAGLSAELIQIAGHANDISQGYKDKTLSKNDIIERMTRGFAPTYGNWCGDGHTQEDRNHWVHDALDWACRTHDLCYRDKGYFNADCDRHFIRQLKALINHKVLDQGGHLYAVGAYAFYSVLRNYGG